MPAISDLATLLATMEPVLNPGTYVFASVTDAAHIDLAQAVATVREPEGMSVVLPETDAARSNLPVLFRCAWITLSVNSDLNAVGLTAALAAALGDAGISCNVVAGALHDHIFVPVAAAEAAMHELRLLQSRAGARA
jgi:hypothetical protein